MSKFSPGDRVVVRKENPGDLKRVPLFIRDKAGSVWKIHGTWENPRDHDNVRPRLYSVMFDLANVSEKAVRAKLFLDLYEDWLLPYDKALEDRRTRVPLHEHELIDRHDPGLTPYELLIIALHELLQIKRIYTIEENRLKTDDLIQRGLLQGAPYFQKRFAAHRELLIEKGIMTAWELDQEIDRVKIIEGPPPRPFERGILALRKLLVKKAVLDDAEIRRRLEIVKARNPSLGSLIVAKAWTDQGFKARLLREPKQVFEEMGGNTDVIPILVVLENTEKVHNILVCTLCSCYPRSLLGEPPSWYTGDTYKRRIIVDPRGVLEEMGVKIVDDVEVRVYDSTSDVRYLVLPRSPEGIEGMSEEELAGLVTRDSLIGAAHVSLTT